MFGGFRKRRKSGAIYKLVKILVLGAANVGKTSLVRHLLGLKFDKHDTSTVYDIYEKQLESEYGHFTFQMTDITGCCYFPTMQSLAISKTDLCLVVYSLQIESSLDRAKSIIHEIMDTRSKLKKEIPIILVGNKEDTCKDKKILHTFHRFQSGDYSAYFNSYCSCHMLTSAKTGTNVSNLLKALQYEAQNLDLINDGFTLDRQVFGQYMAKTLT